MKKIFTILFTIISLNLSGQELVPLEPYKVLELDFGPEVRKEWQIRNKTLDAMSDGKLKWEDMSEQQEKYVLKYGEIYEDIWDIIGSGCSWYCGGAVKEIKSSSTLNSSGDITYDAENAHDLSYETAWVEGVAGHGIGEYLEYTFAATNPRITDIFIVNGYVKNNAVWSANSRVKKLKLYYNDKPIAILNLQDKVAEQLFELENPLGYENRSDMEFLKTQKDWTLKFEILEVYPGSKYTDTVISEIYFSGIDVH